MNSSAGNLVFLLGGIVVVVFLRAKIRKIGALSEAMGGGGLATMGARATKAGRRAARKAAGQASWSQSTLGEVGAAFRWCCGALYARCCCGCIKVAWVCKRAWQGTKRWCGKKCARLGGGGGDGKAGAKGTSEGAARKRAATNAKQLAARHAFRTSLAEAKGGVDEASFRVWLRQYMAIVVVLGLSAVLLFASGGGAPGEVLSAAGSGDDGDEATGAAGSSGDDDGVDSGDGGGLLEDENVKLLLFLLSGAMLIPYYVLNTDLTSRFDSVLFHYSEGQSSGIVYYRNLFEVVFKAPVLLVNW